MDDDNDEEMCEEMDEVPLFNCNDSVPDYNSISFYNDYNDVFVRQKGNNSSHNANITLDGLYGTDLILKQMSTTNQTYTLTQNCITVGGCAVSVTQD